MYLTGLFDKKKFVITSEIGPPKGWKIDKCLHEAEMLKNKVDTTKSSE